MFFKSNQIKILKKKYIENKSKIRKNILTNEHDV